MQTKLMGMTGAGLACVALLSGCGDMNVKKLWPFGADTATQERPRTPASAAEYQCAGNKRFHLRSLDGGASVWLILPERELRLDKLATASGTRYSNGIAVLELNGKEATLKDGTAIAFTGCKTGGS